MTMIKSALSALVAILFLNSFAQAQEEVTLNFVPLPSRSLIVSSRTESVQMVNITGDEAIAARNKSAGITMPMRLSTRETSRMRATSQARQADEGIPVRLEVLEVDSKITDPKGNVTPMKSGMSQFVGARMNLIFKPDGNADFVSIEGASLPPEVAKIDSQTLAGVFKGMAGLEGKRMKVGDKVPHNLAFELPLPGMQPLSFGGLSTYTLESISDGIASFAMSTDYKINQKPGTLQIQGTGSGKGRMDYDIKNALVRVSESVTTFSMKMLAGKAVIDNTIEMKQSVEQTLEAAQ